MKEKSQVFEKNVKLGKYLGARNSFRTIALIALFFIGINSSFAVEEKTGASTVLKEVVTSLADTTATNAEVEAEADANAILSAEVDWVEEIIKGGMTSIALLVLLCFGITFLIERMFNLRAKKIVPPGLPREVAMLWRDGKFKKIIELVNKSPSTFSRIILYLVEYRDSSHDLLIPGASDIGARELKHHSQKTFSLAAIAALAPLLGLLGTMIGMIESFKLVEVYGDEGGASMLAGSISKALITTAVGLIIAIPTLGAYHYLKNKITGLSVLLDEELETVLNGAFLTSTKKVVKESEEVKKEKQINDEA